ncbi:hypothetical protein HDU99_009778, partial [Rhizoclosmatium hyalinum]
LKYNDKYGRNLNAKEAFRELSHKFHGHGSGKMKTEKLLRKIDDELSIIPRKVIAIKINHETPFNRAKLNKMQSTDTPLQTASALLEKTKSAKTAHLVLGVGNRGSLPQDVVAAEEKALLEKRRLRLEAAAKAKELKEKLKKAGGGGGVGGTSSVAGTASIAKGTGSVAPSGARGKIAFGLPGGVKRKADGSGGVGGFEESLAKKNKF